MSLLMDPWIVENPMEEAPRSESHGNVAHS